MSARQPTVVLDTNVVLDWLVFDDPTAHPLGQAIAQGGLRWLRTKPMAEELARVLAYPALQARALNVADILARAEHHSCLVHPAPTAPPALRCADPDDQCFIDLALAHPACCLISRDKAVLAVQRAAQSLGLTVMTPTAWLAAREEASAA